MSIALIDLNQVDQFPNPIREDLHINVWFGCYKDFLGLSVALCVRLDMYSIIIVVQLYYILL